MSIASLTARGPEDILAYIPHAIGFWPRDSLVCLTARSGRIGATLRVDLPARDLRGDALLRYVRAVLSYLEHDSSADSTFVAMFQDTGVAGVRGERAELMALLAWVLGQAGRPVHELWLVGTDGWNGSGCRGAECSLTGEGPCEVDAAHPLDLIRDSRLAAELVFQGSAVDPHPGRPFPPQRQESPGDPGPSTGPHDHPASTAVADDAPLDQPSLAEALDFWEPYLDGTASLVSAASPDGTALRDSTAFPDSSMASDRVASLSRALCHTLEIPAVRDAVYVSAGSSWSIAFQGGRAAAAVLADAIGSEAAHGPEPDEGENPRSPAGQDFIPWLGAFGDVFLAESGTGPDWDRMNHFATILQNLLHQAGDRPPAGVLTGLAWVEWCRGRGSQASALLDQALVVEPGHRLASLLNRAILSGALSGWASRRHSSWRRPLDRPVSGVDTQATPDAEE
ncbi:hypothetical protein QFZ52_001173 [Arthrobacter woluwensis]|uniref:DUF4192 family protein n=1 Tax=Arthrobacter woluwensis TaxID=156980 RepID=UPI0027801BD0|nr:DUF4192 family protein [Arthrobacter woluwensis]MDQ0708521.1 hypothetical protein [Arthrobacter woluwensis]